MFTETISQPQEVISILECIGDIPTTTNTRKVAVVGRESTALSGARALAIASGKTHIVEIVVPGKSIQRLWVRPQANSAATPAAIQPSGVSAIPPSSNPTVQPSSNSIYEVLGRLKSRKPQAGYLVYTGSEADCKLAATLLTGARARRNGETEKNTWLLVVPMPVVYSSIAQPISTQIAA
jgi:hypothetical protein